MTKCANSAGLLKDGIVLIDAEHFAGGRIVADSESVVCTLLLHDGGRDGGNHPLRSSQQIIKSAYGVIGHE